MVFFRNFEGIFEIQNQSAVGNAEVRTFFDENPESFRDFLVERIFRFGWRLLERQWQVRTDYYSFAQKRIFFLPNPF